MRLIKIALANVNTTVGAFRTNTDKAIELARKMSEEGTTLGCFQEQLISGYPPEDLVQWGGFVSPQLEELRRFAKYTNQLETVFTIGVTVLHEGNLYNCVAVVQGGEILGLVPKEKLPTYNVFYEGRTFARGYPGMNVEVEGIPTGDLIFQFPWGVLGAEVCEDIWSPDGPMRRRSYSGAEVIVNASASPFRAGVVATRKEMISTRASDNAVTVVYSGVVGGNDSLVFDGGGFVNQAGRMIFEVPRWKEGVTYTCVDLDRVTRLRKENSTWRSDCEEFLRRGVVVPKIICDRGLDPNAPGMKYPAPANKSFFIPSENPERYFEDLIEAMVMGLGGYFEKTGAFKRIGIALSGGKDSALTLYVAWIYAMRRFNGDAEKIRDFIHCFSMPSRHNSEKTRSIAFELCEQFMVTFSEYSIEEELVSVLRAQDNILPCGMEISPLAYQNIQARIRGTRMWNWTNSTGGMWLQTGNMSEKAVGYTTIGGDMQGAFSLIGNLPKTVVSALLVYLAERLETPEAHREVLRRVAHSTPSAELAENQEDERDLMPFPVLDACFALFAGEKMMPHEVYFVLRQMWSDEEFKQMYPAYTPGLLGTWVRKFIRLFQNSIYKWVQSPQAVHLGSLDLDRERALQLPVVQSGEWLEQSLAQVPG